MNHIENDIQDTVDQIQPDNHRSGQIVQDSNIATLFARLQPQDVEQFYQSYQLWSITSRIQALQAEIEQVQQEKIANAVLLEQCHPSPIAQAVLAQLQAHDVNDIDLLDQMLERGDGWLDHTIQLLEQCEHLDLIHGNYTEWCMHALEGAYDWIGSMHESEATDGPEESAATEVFDESTELLLLQKLLSDEEEALQPEIHVEPEIAVIEEAVTSPSPEEAVVEATTQNEFAQITGIPDEDISSEEEPATPIEPADNNKAEEGVANREISEIIEIPVQENIQPDESAEESAQQTPSITSDANAVLDIDSSTPTDTKDEAEDSVAEIEPDIASGATEATILPEEVEILEEETTLQAPVKDATVETVEDEQTISEVLTESAGEEAAAETSGQDVAVEEERGIQDRSLPEATNALESEDAISNIEEAPVETPVENTTSSSEEASIEMVTEEAVESASQASADVADQQEVTDVASTTPEVEDQPEGEVEAEIVSGEVREETSNDDENNGIDKTSKSTTSPDEATNEPAAMLDHDVQDNSDLAVVKSLPILEENAGQLSLPAAITEIEQAKAKIPQALYTGESDEDTIAIPKISFPTSRVTPLRATVDAETRPTIPAITPNETNTSVRETSSIVEANTIPGLPAVTPPPQAMAPSTTPDIYGETNKQPAISGTLAPIWHESNNYPAPALPQTPSPLLPELHQNFFLRLWFKFLAWLRGE